MKNKEQKAKNRIYNILIFVFLAVCVIFVLLNPVRQLVNNVFSNSTITVYNNQVNTMNQDDKDRLFEEARKYNESLNNNVSDCFSSEAFKIGENYENILNITGDGIMGTVSIPKINVNLPIYHGIDETYYEKGAVHLASTAFPIGGEGSHSIISAHTAYPGKIFFDKLTDVEENDYFYITILHKTFAYKVFSIDVVLPEETELLQRVEGEELCTLVTCTPYAVNTHRLLVRGERDLAEEARLELENININQTTGNPYEIVYYLIIIIILALIISFIMKINKRNKKKKQAQSETKTKT